jgi:hypothetical protein
MKTWVTQCGEDTSVVFQVIELEKQSFVYVGLENDSRLDSACLAMPMRQVRVRLSVAFCKYLQSHCD